MDIARWFRPAISSLAIVAAGASAIALVWVWQWAVTNNSSADYEHQRVLQSTFMACLLIAMPLLFARLLDRDNRSPELAVVSAAATGAFVTVISSIAGTMLVMWMFRSHGAVPDKGERTLFEIAYLCATTLSLVLGAAAAFTNASGTRVRRTFAAATAIIIVLMAYGYLAVGSSELNRCVVKIEFPLDAARHGCSGE